MPAATPALVDGHVSEAQAKKAVDSLSAYAAKARAEKEETELLSKDENVWLVVSTKTINPEKKLKPVKISLPNPIVDPRTTAICLLVKDPQREYKDLIEKHNIKFISRVVGVTKLKGKFKPFEARRQLLSEHGMFLADDRIVPLLPKLLGKGWFDAKKQPVPVCMTRKDLKGELERAVSATYYNPNQGNCTSVKISPLPSHTPAQTLANLLAAIPQVVSKIKGGWDNIQSLNIKTSTSVSLPIWSCPLGDAAGGRWDGMGEQQWEEVTEEASAAAPIEEKKIATTPAKGKKRAVEADVVEDSAASPAGKKSKAALSPSSSKKAKATPTAPSPAPAAAAVAEKKAAVAAGTPSKKAKPAAAAVVSKKTSSISKGVKESIVGVKGGKKGGKKA